ncbi:MAG: ATP-binding protein [Candidatus Riflebacteria bacterium]|nr:ATP-binding protein [Candidatus Riflebacteria bacterium]
MLDWNFRDLSVHGVDRPPANHQEGSDMATDDQDPKQQGPDMEGFASTTGRGPKTPIELRREERGPSPQGPLAGAAPPTGGYAAADHGAAPLPLAEYTPQAPRSIEETRLSPSFLAELLVKVLYFGGDMDGAKIADYACLPFAAVVYPLLTELKTDRIVEIKGGTTQYSASWRFALTKYGSEKAQEVMSRNQYVGPAPVGLSDYVQMVHRQFTAQGVTFDDVRHAFRDLVVPDDLVEKVGSAVNSSKSIFLYGPPGNGKTSVAERIVRMMRGAIYVPHAIEASGQIIKIHDPLDHHPPEGMKPPSTYDKRWVLCKRPMIIVGGELTLRMLDLIYNDVEKFYEAPFQIKSNGGMLLIDDFGRQLVHPKDLLNRWIVPLEKGLDYLTLHTGQKFEAPFRQLVVFSTNMNPKDLVDEAFLRRLRYKIEISDPSEQNYRAIIRRTCDSKGVAWAEEGISYLIKEHYKKDNVPLRACHPRDLVEIILDKARFMRCAPTLDPHFIDMAWNAYFVRYT